MDSILVHNIYILDIIQKMNADLTIKNAIATVNFTKRRAKLLAQNDIEALKAGLRVK